MSRSFEEARTILKVIRPNFMLLSANFPDCVNRLSPKDGILLPV
ncbi:hypothetical protein ACTJIJ_15255 [Niabella sp. 22666]